MMQADFIVIGAGIAGAGVAFELSQHAKVIVLEAESQPGYHSTGRSAALFSEIYGNEVVRALSRASRDFLATPPVSFAAHSLLKPRGCLFVAHPDHLDAFESLQAAPDVSAHTRLLTRDEVLRHVPILRSEWASRGLLEYDAQDVDVHGLHQGFLRGIKERDSVVIGTSSVQSIVRVAGTWEVVASGLHGGFPSAQCAAGHEYRAPIVINAAGAWLDEIAALAGVRPIGIEPRRRTALLIDAPPDMQIDAWPMVIDVSESFYFKPDAGRLLLSPADETPHPPSDVQPDDLDVAIAVDRVEQATTLAIRHVRHRWAGLRSFVTDRSPVVGFDPDAPGFFWLGGQGGYGIQTAPALSRLAAHCARQATPDESLAALLPFISPNRLRSRAPSNP